VTEIKGTILADRNAQHLFQFATEKCGPYLRLFWDRFYMAAMIEERQNEGRIDLSEQEI
jgi:hypothetical protein